MRGYFNINDFEKLKKDESFYIIDKLTKENLVGLKSIDNDKKFTVKITDITTIETKEEHLLNIHFIKNEKTKSNEFILHKYDLNTIIIDSSKNTFYGIKENDKVKLHNINELINFFIENKLFDSRITAFKEMQNLK